MADKVQRLHQIRQTSPKEHIQPHPPNANEQDTLDANTQLLQNAKELPKEQPASLHNQGWVPFFLRRRTLLLFSGLFVLLIIALEIIRKLSKDKHGFGPTESNKHFIWTYVPAAVMAAVAALWAQVDYRSKQMAPWLAMSKKPQSAESSLLLDYISPFFLRAFFLSLRRAHWAVAAAILGTVLVKLLFVLSTALFTLEQRSIIHHVPFSASNRFGGDNYKLASVDDTPVVDWTGALLMDNVNFIPGTTEEYAVQSFNASQKIQALDYSLTAPVETFSADLSCEVGTMSNQTRKCFSGCTFAYFEIDISSPSCQMHVPATNRSGVLWFHASSASWVGTTFIGNCSNQAKLEDTQRLVVFTGYTNETILNSSVILCKPSYTINNSMVTVDATGNVKSVQNINPTDPMPGVSALDLTEAILSSLSQTKILPSITLFGQFASMDPFINLFQIRMPQRDMISFTDPKFLQTAARKVYTALAGQVAKRYFMVDSNTPLQGTAEYVEHRVVARQLSINLMEVILVLLLISVVVLLFFGPGRIIPHDTSSIGGLSAAFSRSKDISKILAGTGNHPKTALKTLLRGQYHTKFSPSKDGNAVFSIEGDGLHKKAHGLITTQRYWRPWMVSDAGFFLLLLLPLAIIVVLEVLLRQSDQHHGLVEVSNTGYSQYAWTYVPAMVMILMQIICADVDFKFRLFSPYYQLKHGTTNVRSSIMDRSMSKLSIQAMWDAMRDSQFALAATAFAVFLTSGLTIAVSGLYTPEAVAMQTPTSLRVLDSFLSPPKDGYRTSNYTSTVPIEMLAKSKMDYPRWTTSQCAIPALDFASSTANGSQSSDINSVKVEVPVWRGKLDCTHLGNDSLILQPFNSLLAVTKPQSFPSFCEGFSGGDINSTRRFKTIKPHPPGLWGDWENVSQVGGSTSSNASSSSCPTTFIWYGNSTATPGSSNFNALFCYPTIEQVNADITFALPDWSVSSILFDDASSKTVADGARAYMDMYSLDNFTRTYPELDARFQYMFRDKSDSQIAELLAESNHKDLIQEASSLYGFALAQVLNQEARAHPNGTLTTLNATATYSGAGNMRLQQSELSTRILQGILIALIFLVAFPVLWRDHDYILPKKPCSIAAVGGLVAGSDMIDLIPSERGSLNLEELQNQVFAGHRFSLGWWQGADGSKRRFGIDIGEAEKVEGRSWKGKVLTWSRLRR